MQRKAGRKKEREGVRKDEIKGGTGQGIKEDRCNNGITKERQSETEHGKGERRDARQDEREECEPGEGSKGERTNEGRGEVQEKRNNGRKADRKGRNVERNKGDGGKK